MARDPLDQMLRGFAWRTGSRAANRVPLWLGILIVVIMSIIANYLR